MKQINTVSSDFDSMTQHNLTIVEEIAESSEEMISQSKELSGMLERFNLLFLKTRIIRLISKCFQYEFITICQ